MSVKPFQYVSQYCNNIGTGAIILEDDTIDVDFFTGPAPYARDIILFLLSDKDVRRMIKKYQAGTQEELFELRTSRGSSGRQDIYINYYADYRLQTHGKKLLHVSSLGKINDGWNKMTIGEFAELVAYLMCNSDVDYDLRNRRKLWKLSGCRYRKGYYSSTATSKRCTLL